MLSTQAYKAAAPLLILLLAGCGPQEYAAVEGFALGTSYRIVVDSTDTIGLRHSIDSIFRIADNSMSLYNPNSLLSRLNRNETDSVDAHIAYCIETAEKISRMGDGEYDITVKPLTQAWGFTGQDAQERPNVDSLLQYVGHDKIKVEKGRLVKQVPQVQIDLNSIAKGYTVDLLGRMLEVRGEENYLVEVGGEIVSRGVNRSGKPWVVGIDKPIEGNLIPGQALQVKLSLSGRGLATSGNYRKFYMTDDGRKVVHTINARTGESRPSNLLSATVIAENCTVADALGTLMMAQGLEKSIRFFRDHPEYLGYLIYSGEGGEYRTYISPGMEKLIVE